MEFDPKNRKKVFRKKLRVITNGKQREIVLRIRGNIIPDESVLRKHVGQLQVNRAELNFGNVLDSEVKIDSMLIYNSSNHIIELEFDFSEKPDNVDISMDKKQLKPKEQGHILGHFRGDKDAEYGFNRFRVNFHDKAYPDSTRGQIIITYNQEEDFRTLSAEERKSAPRMEFDNKDCNFGRKRQGEKAVCVYKFRNTGKRDLIIRNIRLAGMIEIESYDRVTEPGKEGEIILVVDTSRVKGSMIRYIHVMTNCPTSPKVRLGLEGKVIDRN